MSLEAASGCVRRLSDRRSGGVIVPLQRSVLTNRPLLLLLEVVDHHHLLALLLLPQPGCGLTLEGRRAAADLRGAEPLLGLPHEVALASEPLGVKVSTILFHIFHNIRLFIHGLSTSEPTVMMMIFVDKHPNEENIFKRLEKPDRF